MIYDECALLENLPSARPSSYRLGCGVRRIETMNGLNGRDKNLPQRLDKQRDRAALPGEVLHCKKFYFAKSVAFP
jgi:hypothetical protein